MEIDIKKEIERLKLEKQQKYRTIKFFTKEYNSNRWYIKLFRNEIIETKKRR